MSASPPPATQRVHDLLTGLAKERATGSVRVGRAGTVYLAQGRVTYVASPAAPGVERILIASGRAGPAAVKNARAAGGDGAEELVHRGVLTLGELEYCVLAATLDAAYIVLTAPGARLRFRAGDRHWLGGRWYFDVQGLFRECRRRGDQLDHAWPSPAFDTQPIQGRSGKGLFLYLALDRNRANLALARHILKGIEEKLEI